MSTARERAAEEEISKRVKRESAAAAAAGVDASALDGRYPLGRRPQQQHPLLLGPPPPGALNTITPCAACKLLRRRCAQECPFSPYFSPHEPHKFASVHKVFGASNVSKMLLEVPEPQRADAANSLVYEANVRLRDPVYGCMGAISALQQQVQALETELTAIRAEILRHKYRHHNHSASAASVSTAAPSTSCGSMILQPSAAAVCNLLPSAGEVSVAAPPPVPGPPPTAVPASSSSSVYTPPPSASTTYSSITNDNAAAYFG